MQLVYPLACGLYFRCQHGIPLCSVLDRLSHGRILHLLGSLAFLVRHRAAGGRGGREFGVGEIEWHGANLAARTAARPCSTGEPLGTGWPLCVADRIGRAALSHAIRQTMSQVLIGDVSRRLISHKAPAPWSGDRRPGEILGRCLKPPVGFENADNEAPLHCEHNIGRSCFLWVNFPSIPNSRVYALSLRYRSIDTDDDCLVGEDCFLGLVTLDNLIGMHQAALV